MRQSLFFALACLFLVLSRELPAQGNNVRMWKNKDGVEVMMQFIRMDGTQHCIMKTKDGNEHRFALALLSEEDQKLARSMRPLAAATGKNRSSADTALLIDKIIYENCVKTRTRPNEPASDEEFVRRIYLDTVGRIPNLAEVRAFFESENPNKRNELVDELMESEGYKSHLFNYFADMLRVKESFGSTGVRGVSYIKWLKKCIDENRPYNELVHEMLTASGKAWENPATGYLLLDSGMPLDNLANTVSIFLGTEIACAQCHDHPFYDDTWTQAKFYEMASFFGSTVTQLGPSDFKNGNPTQRIRREVEALIRKNGGDPEDRATVGLLNGLNRMIGTNRYVVKDIEENRIKLPTDYKYADHSPGDVLKPKFLEWPKERNYNPREDSEINDRQRFAHWATSKENPMFAKVIANRMWQRAFGIGVAEPVDNLFAPAMDSNPKLLNFLADEMRRTNFDLKAFQRTIFYTKAYQSKATTVEYEAGTNYAFQGPLLRRMSAEQIWDSFMTLQLGNPDRFRADQGELYERAVDLDLENTSGAIVVQKYTAYRNMGKTLQKMQDTRMQSGGDKDDQQDAMTMNVQQRGNEKLLRASELKQPAAADHFLQDFGQSSRRIFDGGTKEGSVPQVLRIMNGPTTNMLESRDSQIYRNMEEEETPEGKVEALFLSILNRRPTEKEQTITAEKIADKGRFAYDDLIWALANTREFLFIQ